MKKLINLLFFIIAIVTLVTCKNDEVTPREYPRVTTLEVSSISESGATFNAEIIYPGNGEILEYGFVWGESSKPTLEDFNKEVQTNSITTGKFSAKISTPLKNGVNYYVRAYAINEKYLVYGKVVPF